MTSFVRFFVLTAVAAIGVFGQTSTGNILGVVQDASGASVAGARVSVVNLGTNTRTEATADSAGNFLVRFLLAGKYAVEAEAKGFKKFRQDGIELQ